MRNKTTLLLAFLAGAVIGAAIVWISCMCCCKRSCNSGQCSTEQDTTGLRHITQQEATAYFSAYMIHPDTVNGLKAYTINFDQYRAMKIIAEGDTSVHGFRIYNGMDSLTPIKMVVGTGSPDKIAKIYVTTDVKSGPCPDVCDDSHQISPN